MRNLLTRVPESAQSFVATLCARSSPSATPSRCTSSTSASAELESRTPHAPAPTSGHVNLDVVGDAADDRVVGPGRLQDRSRHELGNRAVRDESRDEPLPRDAAAEIAVEPEAPMSGAEDLARTDRVRLRRHP